MDLVSAVITTYNRPVETVKRAVQSVLRQTYHPIELIVVNDGPANTQLAAQIGAMLKELDPEIQYLVHEKNLGAGAARNTGLAAAKGKYIAFLDDDDEWLPEKTEKQLALMEEGIGLVSCDAFHISPERTVRHRPTVAAADPVSAILRSNFIGSASFPLLRTEYVRAVGGFETEMRGCEDLELWIRMLLHYRCAHVKEALVNYYMSADSTFKADNTTFTDGSLFILKKHQALYASRPDDCQYFLNNAAISGLLSLKDPAVYRTFKRLAFSRRFFHRYNFFLIPIKARSRIAQKLRG